MTTTINASTSAGLIQTADTSGTLELQSNGTTQLTVASTGAYGQLKSSTAVATTSGTSIDFTGIPSWVKRVTVMFSAVSTNGTSIPLLQIGSGSVATTGYDGSTWTANTSNTTSTAGLLLGGTSTATYSYNGLAILTLLNSSTNAWVLSTFGGGVNLGSFVGGSNKTLSGALDRVRLTTVNGTDAFDAGSINILYEG